MILAAMVSASFSSFSLPKGPCGTKNTTGSKPLRRSFCAITIVIHYSDSTLDAVFSWEKWQPIGMDSTKLRWWQNTTVFSAKVFLELLGPLENLTSFQCIYCSLKFRVSSFSADSLFPVPVLLETEKRHTFQKQKNSYPYFSARNSGAGNGCTNSMGAWLFLVLSAGKPPCP